MKARKLAYYGHTMRKLGSCLEKENARNNAGSSRGKTTHGQDGQHQDVDRTLCERVNQNDRGQRSMEKVVHGVDNPRIEDG